MARYIEISNAHIEISSLMYGDDESLYNQAIHDVLDVLNNQPTADVKEVVRGEWISVSDRLPDWRHGKVLVHTIYGFSICERTVNNQWKGQHSKHITHWMPLPEPPHCGASMRKESDT